MYEITVWDWVSAAHRLRGYKGKCENIHGHNWKISVTLQSEELDSTGLVCDFSRVKSALRDLTKLLDHTCLNSYPYFRKLNPSCENLARFFHEKLSDSLNTDKVRVKVVSVHETETAGATYAIGDAIGSKRRAMGGDRK
jgi:6-pyruvoyltetrahydropterin/6-carboxytetrahydropterin synthase